MKLREKAQGHSTQIGRVPITQLKLQAAPESGLDERKRLLARFGQFLAVVADEDWTVLGEECNRTAHAAAALGWDEIIVVWYCGPSASELERILNASRAAYRAVATEWESWGEDFTEWEAEA